MRLNTETPTEQKSHEPIGMLSDKHGDYAAECRAEYAAEHAVKHHAVKHHAYAVIHSDTPHFPFIKHYIQENAGALLNQSPL